MVFLRLFLSRRRIFFIFHLFEPHAASSKILVLRGVIAWYVCSSISACKEAHEVFTLKMISFAFVASQIMAYIFKS